MEQNKENSKDSGFLCTAEKSYESTEMLVIYFETQVKHCNYFFGDLRYPKKEYSDLNIE